MDQNTLAIISDIHGNSTALKEVIKDIKSRGINTIVNLGDSLYGPLDPAGTFSIISENEMISISGNQDRFLLECLGHETGIPTLESVKTQLTHDMISWMKMLEFDTIVNNRVYCCHGTPQRDSDYLIEQLNEGFIYVRPETELNEILKNIDQSIVVCGHSHVPNLIKAGRFTIINPGSVGLPAYDDDEPVYHKMENHNPSACYSILEFDTGGVKIDQVSLPYDFEKAAQLAEKNNRTDWARWIRTGKV